MKLNVFNIKKTTGKTSIKKDDHIKRKTVQQKLEDFSDSIIHRMGSNASLAVHSMLFGGSFLFIIFGFNTSDVLLVLTTAVSLEAIYLAIFIQMSVNKNTRSLKEVEKDIDEIQEDVEEIQEDVEEIQEDIDEIQEDVEEIEKDVDSIEKDVDELQEDVEEIHENIQEDAIEESEEEKKERERDDHLLRVQNSIHLIQMQLDILVEEMKKERKPGY